MSSRTWSIAKRPWLNTCSPTYQIHSVATFGSCFHLLLASGCPPARPHTWPRALSDPPCLSRTSIARERGWKKLKEELPDVINLILIRLWKKEQPGPLAWNPDREAGPEWKNHPFVDPKVNARLIEDRCLPRANLMRMDPEQPDIPFYPTYRNWHELEPAKAVFQWVARRNQELREDWARRNPGLAIRMPDRYVLDEEDYLHNCHRVFQPVDDRPEGKNDRKTIRAAHKRRRLRTLDVLELFYRANLYDLPDGPLGNLRNITHWGAPMLGVPTADTYITDLRRKLSTDRQPQAGVR